MGVSPFPPALCRSHTPVPSPFLTGFLEDCTAPSSNSLLNSLTVGGSYKSDVRATSRIKSRGAFLAFGKTGPWYVESVHLYVPPKYLRRFTAPLMIESGWIIFPRVSFVTVSRYLRVKTNTEGKSPVFSSPALVPAYGLLGKLTAHRPEMTAAHVFCFN